MAKSHFNSAEFLNHHWFQNIFQQFSEKDKFPPYTLKNLSIKKTLKHIKECHKSKNLAEALSDIPDDIMLFLSKYAFIAKKLSKKLSREEFYNYYVNVEQELLALMEKYKAT